MDMNCIDLEKAIKHDQPHLKQTELLYGDQKEAEVDRITDQASN